MYGLSAEVTGIARRQGCVPYCPELCGGATAKMLRDARKLTSSGNPERRQMGEFILEALRESAAELVANCQRGAEQTGPYEYKCGAPESAGVGPLEAIEFMARTKLDEWE